MAIKPELQRLNMPPKMKQQKLNEDMSAEKNQKNFTVLNT